MQTPVITDAIYNFDTNQVTLVGSGFTGFNNVISNSKFGVTFGFMDKIISSTDTSIVVNTNVGRLINRWQVITPTAVSNMLDVDFGKLVVNYTKTAGFETLGNSIAVPILQDITDGLYDLSTQWVYFSGSGSGLQYIDTALRTPTPAGRSGTATRQESGALDIGYTGTTAIEITNFMSSELQQSGDGLLAFQIRDGNIVDRSFISMANAGWPVTGVDNFSSTNANNTQTGSASDRAKCIFINGESTSNISNGARVTMRRRA